MIFRTITITVLALGFSVTAFAKQGRGVSDGLLDKYIGEMLAVNNNSAPDAPVAAPQQTQEVIVTEKTDPNVPVSKPVDPNAVVESDAPAATTPQPVEQNAEVKDVEANEDVKVSHLLEESKKLREKLHQSSLSGFGETKKQDAAQELQDAIAMLNSLQIEERAEVPMSAIDQVKMPEMIDPQAIVDAAVQDENEKILAIGKSAQENVQELKEEAIEIARILPIDDADVVNPFKLAEMLFKMNRQKLALKYYRIALIKFNDNRKKIEPDRGWTIFQIGNCLFDSDPKLALISYDQLLEEHPDSNWGQLARSKRNMLQWVIDEEPILLTEKNAPVAKN